MEPIPAQLEARSPKVVIEQIIQFFTADKGLFLPERHYFGDHLLMKTVPGHPHGGTFVIARPTYAKSKTQPSYGVSFFLEVTDDLGPKFFFRSDP